MGFPYRVILAALFLAGSVSAGDGLHTRAKVAGPFFGTAVSTTILGDSAANSIVLNPDDFGQYTPENELKFDETEPSQNTFVFDKANAIIGQAEANGMSVRCHNLVWHQRVPSWVTNGGFDNATLISIMENHITNVVGQYKGRCYAWDVVNEALNDDGSYRTESVWYQIIGPAYIPIAFAAAAKADPNAKLYYNDYDIDRAGAKASGALELVKMIQSYGAPIDGIGFQGHLYAGSVGGAGEYIDNWSQFVGLGLEVAVTELDIRVTDSSQFAQQAADYATIVNACKGVSQCVGITIWGSSDKYSWIRNHMPLPWDASYEKKEAYTSILEAWGAAPADSDSGDGSSGDGDSGDGDQETPTTSSATAEVTPSTNSRRTSRIMRHRRHRAFV